MSEEAGLPDDAETTPFGTRHRTDAERLLDRLADLGWSIAVAESLTGGLVTASLVGVPGASARVRGGVVAYSIDIKHSLLGVEAQLLEAHGAVHPEVARQMAQGVRRALRGPDGDVHVGVATTGIAGPDSPDEQPVGTVHLAVSTPLGTRVESVVLQGSRDEIRIDAARSALLMALNAL